MVELEWKNGQEGCGRGGGGDGRQNIVTTWQPKKKVPENPTKKVLFEEKWHKITTFPKKKKSQIC